MFTGIIEALGTVTAGRAGGGVVLSVELGELADGAKIGDSIAVNGVCLTIVALNGTKVDFDVSRETQARSAIATLRHGCLVNLERPIQAGAPFGGHIVQGHIDGTGNVKAIKKSGEFAEITFAADTVLLDEMLVKGSVAVDGISLTVAKMDAGSFTAAVIPTTLKKTNLSTIKIGEAVNIETDIIIKAVKKQLSLILPQTGNLTIDKLKEFGF